MQAKIKIFGWRVLHAIIPGKGVLANRHIGNLGGCPICSACCEDIKYLLFTCERAKLVWRELGIWNLIEYALEIDRSGSVILEELITRGGNVPLLNNLGILEAEP